MFAAVAGADELGRRAVVERAWVRLAIRAPAGGTAGGVFADEGGLAGRAGAAGAGGPSVAVEPGGGWFPPIDADGGEGAAGDPSDLLVQGGPGRDVELAGWGERVPSEAPEDFVGHPIAHAWENGLIEEDGFDGGAGASGELAVDPGWGESGGEQPWGEGRPPGGWRLGGAIEPDASEHPRIGEDEGAGGEMKNEVVVASRRIVRSAGPQFSGHSEMDSEPVAV